MLNRIHPVAPSRADMLDKKDRYWREARFRFRVDTSVDGRGISVKVKNEVQLGRPVQAVHK